MGLLNRRLRPFDQAAALNQVLAELVFPYTLQDFLLAVLNQLALWIPGDGYYAYAADPEDPHLILRVTRAATGIASVGPNYAGLVMGASIRPVPLELPPQSDPWAISATEDGMLQCGFGPYALLRIALPSRTRLLESEHRQINQWLRQIAPILDLVRHTHASNPSNRVATSSPSDHVDPRLDFSLQIPRVVQLLCGLGADVVSATDGFLVTWDDRRDGETVWSIGLGLHVQNIISPIDLYQKSRHWRYALWNADTMPPALLQSGFKSLLALPLNPDENSGGILCYVTTAPVEPSESLGTTLERLVGSLNTSLGSRQAATRTARSYLDTLLASTTLLDQADPYNKNHHSQVAQLCARIGIKLGLPQERVANLELAGRLHDLGMVTVALEMTARRGNLAEQSREIIQQHPTIGADLLLGLPEDIVPPVVSQAIREHHERWDGTGYPSGLAQHALSLEGRILGCAEQFVARISNRSYRAGLPVSRALYDIHQLANHHLDPEVVSCLLDLYRDAGATPVGPSAS